MVNGNGIGSWSLNFWSKINFMSFSIDQIRMESYGAGPIVASRPYSKGSTYFENSIPAQLPREFSYTQ
jgi:hypothetical protein